MAYEKVYRALRRNRELARALADSLDKGDVLACGDCPACQEGPDPEWLECTGHGDGYGRRVSGCRDACAALYDAVDDADAYFDALDSLDAADMAYDAAREASWDR